jgi:hypothetical protein
MDVENREEVDALCPECGHSFKVHMDRVFPPDGKGLRRQEVKCPVCGCGECKIGE